MSSVTAPKAASPGSAEVTQPLLPWLRSVRRGWWRALRPLAVTLLALAALLCAYELLATFVAASFAAHKPNYAAHGWEYFWVRSGRLMDDVFAGVVALEYAGASFLLLSLALAHRVPPELVLAYPARQLYSHLLAYIRICGYIYFAVLLGVAKVLLGVAAACLFAADAARFNQHPWLGILEGLAPLVLCVEFLCFLVARYRWSLPALFLTYCVAATGVWFATVKYQSWLIESNMDNIVVWQGQNPTWFHLLQAAPAAAYLVLALGLYLLDRRPPPGFAERVMASSP